MEILTRKVDSTHTLLFVFFLRDLLKSMEKEASKALAFFFRLQKKNIISDFNSDISHINLANLQ